jgi:hypothetical protein
MSAKKPSITFRKAAYPLTVSLSMIIAAVVLSFVDLAFLNDVIGKILDFGTAASMLVAFALGLVGIVIMAHQGVKAAHGEEDAGSNSGHYILWVALGLAFVTIRLFSASILHLDGSSTDDSLISVMGLNIREVDIVLAPLMFFLYLATGLMVKDGVKNLLLNPDFEKRLAAWREARAAKKQEQAERRKLAEAKMQKQADGSYGQALAQYRAKENEIKAKYQQIAANIDFVKSIDKQEKDFEAKVKPGLMRIIEDSVYSVQSNVTLSIRKQYGEDIAALRAVIESHNAKRLAKNR